MSATTVNSFLRSSKLPLIYNSRNTWILRRVFTPEPTLDGFIQKNPNTLQEFQKYETVEYRTNKPAPPVKIILTCDVEGVGHQFDIVDVSSKAARTNLLLSKKAVYASPFDLKYYSEMKEKMAEELSSRIRIPFEFKQMGRELQKTLIPIKVSLNNAWVVNKTTIRSSLRQKGIFVPLDSLHLCQPEISGPSFDLEAKIVRFYIVISKQYIVPMLGRITHISVDEAKQIISPAFSSVPSDDDLRKHGLRPEFPIFSRVPEFDENYPVVEFMKDNAPSKPS
ncbi:unnamed protein product [Caenorhabditis auriculariae]|uniref:Large ribosomal subunit protein bL9m n=1 Tax=Caenorhabditis auriculariae TaxID=2777116 RepID=A0A8S1GM26_9PELO|nr:unnamed protein product [Caenorhabditis auriculariae]